MERELLYKRLFFSFIVTLAIVFDITLWFSGIWVGLAGIGLYVLGILGHATLLELDKIDPMP